MSPIDTDDFELRHRLLIEQARFRSMVRRLSVISFMTGATLYCIGTIIDQQSVAVTAAVNTMWPLGWSVGIILSNEGVWQQGKHLRLKIHKFCVTLWCALIGFDLGVLCAAIGV